MILLGTGSLNMKSISSGLITETSTWSFNWKGRIGTHHDIMLALNNVICFVNLLHISYLAMFRGFIEKV